MKINKANTTQIIWTVLPNGMSGGSLQMSVFVSPRLVMAGGGSGALKDFALGNWPARVGAKGAAPSAEIAMMQASPGAPLPLSSTYQRATGNANGAGLALMKAALFFNHGDHRASAAKLTGRTTSASAAPVPPVKKPPSPP